MCFNFYNCLTNKILLHFDLDKHFIGKTFLIQLDLNVKRRTEEEKLDDPPSLKITTRRELDNQLQSWRNTNPQ